MTGSPRWFARRKIPGLRLAAKSIYFASDRTGSWQIWKQPLNGGPPSQITTASGFAPQESADGKWIYYAKLNSGALCRMPSAGGTEELVLDAMRVGSWGAWALSANRIIYATLAGDRAASAELRSFDPDTGASKVLATLAHPPVQWDGAIAISPDGRYALVAEVERQGSEIHLQADR